MNFCIVGKALSQCFHIKTLPYNMSNIETHAFILLHTTVVYGCSLWILLWFFICCFSSSVAGLSILFFSLTAFRNPCLTACLLVDSDWQYSVFVCVIFLVYMWLFPNKINIFTVRCFFWYSHIHITQFCFYFLISNWTQMTANCFFLYIIF